jgi:hypothetical protein
MCRRAREFEPEQQFVHKKRCKGSATTRKTNLASLFVPMPSFKQTTTHHRHHSNHHNHRNHRNHCRSIATTATKTAGTTAAPPQHHRSTTSITAITASTAPPLDNHPRSRVVFSFF